MAIANHNPDCSDYSVDSTEEPANPMSAMDQVYGLIVAHRKESGDWPMAIKVPEALWVAAFRELSRMTANAVGGGAEPSENPPDKGYILYGVRIGRE